MKHRIDKVGHSVIYRLRHRKRVPIRIKTKQRTAFIPPGYEPYGCSPLRRLQRTYGFVFQLEMF